MIISDIKEAIATIDHLVERKKLSEKNNKCVQQIKRHLEIIELHVIGDHNNSHKVECVQLQQTISRIKEELKEMDVDPSLGKVHSLKVRVASFIHANVVNATCISIIADLQLTLITMNSISNAGPGAQTPSQVLIRNANPRGHIEYAPDLCIEYYESRKYKFVRLPIEKQFNDLPFTPIEFVQTYRDFYLDMYKKDNLYKELRATNKDPGDWFEMNGMDLVANMLHAKFQQEWWLIYARGESTQLQLSGMCILYTLEDEIFMPVYIAEQELFKDKNFVGVTTSFLRRKNQRVFFFARKNNATLGQFYTEIADITTDVTAFPPGVCNLDQHNPHLYFRCDITPRVARLRPVN